MKRIFTKKSIGLRLFYVFSVIILAVAVFFYRDSLFHFKSEIKDNIEISNRKNVGDIESIIEYGDRVNIVAHYPKFNNETIDKSILMTVESHISDFRNEILQDDSNSGNLHIDYDSYVIDNKYISIAMNYVKNMSFHASTEELVENRVYDLSNGYQLTIKDVIDESKMSSFIDMVSSEIKNKYNYEDEALKNDISEFMNNNAYDFYFDNDGIVVRFDKYSILPGYLGVPSVSLKYDDVKALYKNGFSINKVNNAVEIQKEDIKPKETNVNTSKRNIDPNKPMVAITFDDGPHPEHTRAILSALKKYNGAATFYVLGKRATVYSDVIQEIHNSGSEIGNHSWAHADYSKLNSSDIKTDKNKVQNTIKEIIGTAPATIRVPYGATNKEVEAGVGMPVILWSVDTNDWKDKDKAVIVQRATSNIKDGDIILMHDIWKETADAVPDILKELSNKGFQIVTVSEMAQAKGITLNSGKKYFSIKNNK